MKIFLTGASGYIGGSLAESLLADGHEIHGLARNEERAQQLRSRGMHAIVATLDEPEPLAAASREALDTNGNRKTAFFNLTGMRRQSCWRRFPTQNGMP